MWEPGTGNRESRSGCSSTRGATRGFSIGPAHAAFGMGSRFPVPRPRFPALSATPLPNPSLLREVVEREAAEAVVRRPVAAEGIDVATEGAVALVLREVQVVDADLAHDVAVLRDLEALDRYGVRLRGQRQVSRRLR